MNVAIVGLGLIGGSMAKSIKNRTSHTVWGIDLNAETMTMARMCGAIDAPLTEENLPQADLILVAIRPGAAIEWVRQHAPQIAKSAILVDLCGVKRTVVAAIAPIAEERGFSYIGGHPMAGKETSRIFHADGKLFRGAHYILTPRPGHRPEHLDLLRRIAAYIGCRDVVETTTQKHDAIIAYTSQVMHIMAVAVCDDPDLFECRGFEGGSFRDCTRVAALDVPLWTELFSMNASALTKVIRNLEDNLRAYRQVLEQGDTTTLTRKLAWSADRKRHMNLE